MENLRDILRRLDTTRSISSDQPPLDVAYDNGEPGDSCVICGGRGWFTRDVPAGDPEFGQVVTCHCQQERLEEERSARLLRYSNLGYLSRFTFETLDLRYWADEPEGQRLFNEAHRAAANYADTREGWLVFVGPNGSGKTHLAAAIANSCIDNGHPAFFVNVPDLLDHLRSAFGPASDVSYSDLFDQVKSAPLLILDGLTGRSATPWAQEKLQQIVNHRFNGRMPTVITTASQLSDLDSYISSRLQTPGMGQVVEVQRRNAEPVSDLGRIEPEMLSRMTFDTFDVRGNNPSAKQRETLAGAYQAAKNFAADPDGWLTLFGETGVGKTHLAVAAAVEQLRMGQTVFFAFVPELLDYLRYTFTPDSRVTYDQVFDEVKNTHLLVLDDLGQEHSSPWAEEKLYQIIVHRHNTRLPTIITSRLGFTQQAGPISSRVRDPRVGLLVNIDAPDYRIRERSNRVKKATAPNGPPRPKSGRVPAAPSRTRITDPCS